MTGDDVVEEVSPQEANSMKRNPRWMKELMKEASDSVRKPK